MRITWLPMCVVPALLLMGSAVADDALPKKYRFIQDAFPEVEVTSVKPSPIPGVLQMAVGAELYYVSEDGKYFISGDIYGLTSRENLTEAARNEARGAYLASLGDDAGIMFPAPDEKYVVTVFTDIDCPYCRKLHREMADYNERGISVRYLFFPRQGPGSPAWLKADAVWCSASRQDAMTASKNGVEVEADADCTDTPVAAHYQLGKDLGITGTPAIFTESGQLIVGYQPAAELLNTLQAGGS